MKLLFKPLNFLVSALGGLLAGMVFTRLWRLLTGQDEAPDADSTQHRTSEVLFAAILQGAVIGGVRAAVDRAGARGIRSLSGESEPQPES
ncbi:MAG TPA: DUF4235 domain-containing protein [Pseudonocardia sp.]|jgi:hypothetical protein|uniref:DUF4235 domain-containing protein n=1 Tax=Pseudonocardia sp. TaxID=60912 RepID=UPI002F41F90E